MKRWIAALLAILLLAPGARAQDMPQVNRAAQWYDPEALGALPGYQMDEATGAWRCGAVAAQAQLDALGRSGLGRACLMQLVYTGDARTGLIQPVLQLDVLGEELKCAALSLLIAGTRYDLPVQSERATVGQRKVDRLTAPLTKAGLDMVAALAREGQAQLRLHGERTYTTTIDLHYGGTDAKKKLEAGARNLLDVPGAPHMASYGLWDLSGAAWKAAHGWAPRMDAQRYPGKLEDMVSPGSSGTRVRDMEKALIAAGLMSGAADGQFSTRTRDAILRAQRLYDLVPTGSGDGRLIDLLETGLPAPAAKEAAPRPELALGGARLRFDRWWTARALGPSAPQSMDADQLVAVRNGDDRLLVVEGWIENTGAQPLRPDWQLTGQVILGGAEYALSFLAEKDGGASFGGQVLPQGRARLVAVAQIPPAADGPGQMTVRLGGTALSFALQQ